VCSSANRSTFKSQLSNIEKHIGRNNLFLFLKKDERFPEDVRVGDYSLDIIWFCGCNRLEWIFTDTIAPAEAPRSGAPKGLEEGEEERELDEKDEGISPRGSASRWAAVLNLKLKANGKVFFTETRNYIKNECYRAGSNLPRNKIYMDIMCYTLATGATGRRLRQLSLDLPSIASEERQRNAAIEQFLDMFKKVQNGNFIYYIKK